MKHSRFLLAASALLALGTTHAATAGDPAFDAQLLSIQQAWAKVNYETPAGDTREQAFKELEKRAEQFTQQHPTRAEALIWEGIIESSYAGAKGGLGALGLAKEARGNLEKALQIDPGALIGPGAVIGEHAAIGAGARIEANAVIGPGVAIGRGSRIGAGSVVRCALIGDRVNIGPGVFIGQPGFGVTQDDQGLIDLPHFGRVIIQDGVSIGSACAIDRGMLADTLIAEETKLDNFCHIAHNAQIGRQVRMAAFAGISGSTSIGDRTVLAGRVGVVDHRRVGSDVVLAACSAVLHDVPDGAFWCGYPAKPRMQWLREVAWLARAAKQRAE